MDIDKIQKFPITFVIKTTDDVQHILEVLKGNSEKLYSIEAIIEKYMQCIEEVYLNSKRKIFRSGKKKGI